MILFKLPGDIYRSASSVFPSNFPPNDTYAPVYVMRKLVWILFNRIWHVARRHSNRQMVIKVICLAGTVYDDMQPPTSCLRRRRIETLVRYHIRLVDVRLDVCLRPLRTFRHSISLRLPGSGPSRWTQSTLEATNLH